MGKDIEMRHTQNKETGFSLDDTIQMPPPGMAVPANMKFSPDRRWISYVFSEEGTLVNKLYKMDVESGEKSVLFNLPDSNFGDEDLSTEEQLRRERQRQRSLGVTHYFWAKKENKLMVPLKGSIYTQNDVLSDPVMIVDGSDNPALDPQISPDGRWVAYVQDAELYIIPFEGGDARQITSGARGTGKTHGLAEFVAQEEMHRMHGFWWSPDSQMIAYTEVDETHIPEFTIVHQGKRDTGPSGREIHGYPFAGEENARVRLGVINIHDLQPAWLDLGVDEEVYLARVAWFSSERLTVQITNREQTTTSLLAFDMKAKQVKRLLHEESAIWINLNHLLRPLKNNSFIWASERSGFLHLYLYDQKGHLIRPLTAGDWRVDELNAVDERGERVYFSATKDDVRERQLYSVSLQGGEVQRITPESGTHHVSIDPKFEYYIDRYDSIHQAPVVALRELKDSNIVLDIHVRSDERLEKLNLPAPEMFQFENEIGTTLYGMIYHPPKSFGEGPHPAIVFVYGGPGSQQVSNSWMSTVKMIPQYLASQGYLVFQVDNRGSARRGLEFEGALKHWTGRVEVEDQAAGVKHLAQRGLVDPQRVGVFGWSYGGYMSIMCLVKEPQIFKAAVSGAPSVYWDGYDTHYTERYMGTPQENADGYKKSSPIPYLDQMQGELMLVHGLIDENVHFRHTARFINELIAADKDYELVLLPDARHSVRRPQDLRYYLKRMSRFFRKHL